ncbi:MAG: hypothetical protein AB7P02_24390 [Alphaproteobacteria bacterium]
MAVPSAGVRPFGPVEPTVLPYTWRNDPLFMRAPMAAFVFIAAVSLACLPWLPVYAQVVDGPFGFLEVGTPIMALYGMTLAVRLLCHRRNFPSAWMVVWFGFFAVGCFVFAGEDVNWGQIWFRWATPAGWEAINIEKETNLHNLSLWAEQIPKAALTVAVLVTGVVWPLWARSHPAPWLVAATPFRFIWPNPALWPAAAFALAIRIFERGLVWAKVPGLRGPILHSIKEMIEVFLIMFVVLYLLDMCRIYARDGGR